MPNPLHRPTKKGLHVRKSTTRRARGKTHRPPRATLSASAVPNPQSPDYTPAARAQTSPNSGESSGAVDRLTAEERLTVGAPQIEAPALGQVHALKAKSIKATPRPRKKASPRIKLIQTVLREQIPEWRERFPTIEEVPNEKLRFKAENALKKDPRTSGLEWEWKKIRKSLMRAVGREKLK